MDVKNRRNLPNGLPFRNKAPGQITLIQSKLTRPSESNTSLLGRFASCASTLPNQITFKFGVLRSTAKCRAFLDQRRGERPLGKHSKVGRRGGGLKMDWTKPLPSALPMCIDCRRDLWRGSDGAGSGQRRGLSGWFARPPVGYHGVGGTTSVPWKMFAMRRVAALLLLFGLAKLVRRNLICIRKQSCSS